MTRMAMPRLSPSSSPPSACTRPDWCDAGDHWRGLDQVEYATLEYVDCFNHRRLLEPLDIPPAEKEANYYRQHTQRS